MAFNPDYQPILLKTGKLALGCYETKVTLLEPSIPDKSLGSVTDASFALQADINKLEYGYPKKLRAAAISTMKAVATVTCLELGLDPVKTLLQVIASSINSGEIKKLDSLSLKVFKPRGKDIKVTFSEIFILPQFELAFSQDFNKVKLHFEQPRPRTADTSITDQIAFSEIEEVTTSTNEEDLLVTEGALSIGFALVSTVEATPRFFSSVQGVTLRVSSEYSRLEVGYPKELLGLTLLSSNVEVEIVSEELTLEALQEVFIAPAEQGERFDLLIQAGLYDGTCLSFTLGEVILAPGGESQFKQKEFSTLTKKFIATGDTPLTIT